MRAATILLFLIALCTFSRLEAAPASDKAPLSEGYDSVKALVSRLQPMLNAENKSARVYYQGVCSIEGRGYVDFPAIWIGLVADDAVGVNAVRQIVPKDAVIEERAGIISIRIGKVRSDILDTKIAQVDFSLSEQYHKSRAIQAIEDTAEVQAAERKLGVWAQRPIITIGNFGAPVGIPPLLPRSLSNLTFDQALDEVANAFGGIIFFGTCEEQNLYTINFAGGYWYQPK